jgi:ubiquinone/menaquinone biosynthesis C-methylase UbiE
MKDEFSMEAKLYDKVWGKHDYDADIKFLDDLLRKHNFKSVIDIGCGTGNHTLRLSKLGYSVQGVDISQTMLKIARRKDENAKIRFMQGDMKKLGKIVPKNEKFDAAICLGHPSSSLMTDSDVQAFLRGTHKILKNNGLLVFDARNAKKINEEYLNTLRLDHIVNEGKLQLLVLAYNTRDSQDPSIIVWRPIFLKKENGKVDLQLREHKLRWFEFSSLKRIMTQCGFKLSAAYSGPHKEKFSEDEHVNIWLVAASK